MANGILQSVLPLAGTAIGAGLAGPGGGAAGAQVGLAGGQLLAGLLGGKRAQAATPPGEDPELRVFLNEIQQRRKELETGAGFQTQRRLIGQQLATTQRGIVRAGGGATGATISGLARAQRVAGTQLGEVLGQAEQRQLFLTQMAGQIIGDIGQRKLELQLLERGQALAESKQVTSEGLSNLLAQIAGGGAIPGAGGAPGAPPDVVGRVPGATPPIAGEGTPLGNFLRQFSGLFKRRQLEEPTTIAGGGGSAPGIPR